MKIELAHIHKTFGSVRANADISLTIPSGQIYGLLGENGAGKSTLMKVLSGFISPDSGGEIRLDGQAVRLGSPDEAIRHGVGMLHQDPLDVPAMSVLENFILGRDNRLWQNGRSALTDFQRLSTQFNFSLNPQSPVSDLSVGERQQLEIMRLLWLGVQCLILDEPTTGISAPQKIALFATLRQLAAQGKTILFVSHKLEDIEALCQQAAVLRQGRLVGEMTAPFQTTALVEMMFGQAIAPPARAYVPLGAPLLKLEQFSVSDGRLHLPPFDLQVPAGEVIGLAGLEGSGQSLFLQALAGLHAPAGGKLWLEGQAMGGQPYGRYLDAGVQLMPANRLAEGLIDGLTIAEHVWLAQNRHTSLFSRLNPVAMAAAAAEPIRQYRIKGQATTAVQTLSGGNQQRTLLALLPPNLRLLLMEHPTRGLDIESAQEIWLKLLERRAQGTAILYTSADLDEILQYSDRVLVFYSGRVTAVLPTAQTNLNDLGRLIAGKSVNDAS